MGYIDDERQMSYIKQDIETNIGREIAEYHQQLMEVTQGFNEDNVKSFERRLQTMQARKTTLSTRLKNFSSIVGGDIDLNTDMFNDVSVTIGRNVSRIRSVQSAAAQSIIDLAKIE
jgi:flagellar motor switch/type III secretory pathway protein FliN